MKNMNMEDSDKRQCRTKVPALPLFFLIEGVLSDTTFCIMYLQRTERKA